MTRKDKELAQHLSTDRVAFSEYIIRSFNHVFSQLKQIKELNENIMSAQDDLNSIAASEVADIAAIGAAIKTVTDAIAAEEAAEAAGSAVDLTAIKAAADSLKGVSANVLAIAAAPPVVVPPAPPVPAA